MMDEQATFDVQAVLSPRRARTSRLVLVLPAVALVAIGWAGLSSSRQDRSTAEMVDPTAIMEPSIVEHSPAVDPPFPAQVLGLGVGRLSEVLPLSVDRDEIVVVAGWYVATAITDCPRVAITRRDGELPQVHPEVDRMAYCDRSGVLFNSRPAEGDQFGSAGFPVITTTLALGIRVPPELEVVGGAARQVVVLGRLVPGVPGCERVDGCSRELVVDHVAWTVD